jgi:hypothetical protein
MTRAVGRQTAESQTARSFGQVVIKTNLVLSACGHLVRSGFDGQFLKGEYIHEA